MIKLQNISKYYQSETNITQGLHKINLEFEIGDFVAITGESGSGKSTLLNIISGSDTYEDGEMYFAGEETSYYDQEDWENYRRDNIGFIYQNYNLIDSLSVMDNVKIAILIVHPEMRDGEANHKAMGYLRKVGLTKQARKKASHLSSGQKQRLSIARALAKETPVVVADEPTGNLDAENSKQIVALLHELSKDRLVLMVTHNYDEVERYATRKIRMYNGEVAEDIRLKPNQMKEMGDAQKEKKTDQKTLLLMAKRMATNMRKTKPRSRIFLLLLMFLLFVGIGIFYTSFVKSLDFTTAKQATNKNYFNLDQRRISVKKQDGSAFTREDVEKLEKISYVEQVDLYDIVNDMNYVMREGEDYIFRYRSNEGTGNLPEKVTVDILDDTNMLRTSTSLERKDLTDGEMPLRQNEIILNTEDTSMIGREVVFYVTRSNNWNDNYIKIQGIVTGITDIGEENQIYISESLAKALNVTASRLDNYNFYGIYGEMGTGLQLENPYEGDQAIVSEEQITENANIHQLLAINPIFFPNDLLTETQINLSQGYFADAYILPQNDYQAIQYTIIAQSYLFYGTEEKREELVLQIQDYATKHGTQVIEVSRQIFDLIYPDQNSYQASVYITDYAYTDRALKKIEKAGYEGISVYRASTTEYDWDQVQEQIHIMVLSLVCLVGVFVIGILLIRLLMSARKKDYRILLLLGMKRIQLDQMNRNDLTVNGVIAFVGASVFIYVASKFNLPLLGSAFRYLDVKGYIIYGLILFAMMVLLYRSIRFVRRKSRRDI